MKKNQDRKRQFESKVKTVIAVFILSVICLAGCSQNLTEGSGVGDGNYEKTENDSPDEQTMFRETEKIAECCRSIYESALEENSSDSLPVRQKIVTALGDAGYASVDVENEINMEHPELVRQFCEKAQKKQDAEVTILSVLDNGGFTRYDLQTTEGKLNVTRCMLQWTDTTPEAGNFSSFEACSWSYTEKGYLFFEEYRPSGYDGPGGHAAIRVNLLDETCREYNRKYLEPVGYGQNNLFLTDWTEEEYGELNFYDMYDALYTVKHGEEAYYQSRDVGGRNPKRQQGAEEYEIPRKEFEEVICFYFPIDPSVLREKTVYHEQTETYRYRPRTVYDCGTGSIPSPEVVDYMENEDGTVTLTVEAVWVEESNDCAWSHEVVVRPFADGSFQYVSNRVIPSEDSVNPTWYRERLTDEEWEEHFGNR